MSDIANASLSHIRAWLYDDGYDESLAAEVREAARRGCLVWTRERLTTTDASRIDVRPCRRDEDPS